MPTLRISFDDLDDILNKKTGNPLADEYIVPLLQEVVRRGGTVIVELDGQKAKVVLSKAASPKKRALGAVAGRGSASRRRG